MGLGDEPYAGVGHAWADLTLGELIRAARGQRSQKCLADALGISEATVGANERGERVPGLDVLSCLAALVEDKEARADLLTRWLAKWVQLKVEGVGEGLAARPLLDQAAAGLVGALARRPLPPVYPRTLQGFPEQFQPLIGVFPDRREVPPDSPADLFIRSGAVTDFQYLPLLESLGDRFTICSDKFFVLMKEEWLRERFAGHHLLVVGSSGVNWLTRQLARTALFRPLISPYWRAWDREYRSVTELDDHRMLGVFWRLLEQVQHSHDHKVNPGALTEELLGREQHRRLPRAMELIDDLLQGRTESAIVQQFRVPGFADPADGELHGRLPGDNNDFGVITLAPHPFDDSGDYVAIVCAGISGPGTAHGLKALLTEQELFAAHPFGGVVKVNLPARENDWPGRFENAGWVWQTQPYTPEKILGKLRAALAAPKVGDREPAFQDWTAAELEDSIAFVQRLDSRSDAPPP